MVISVSPQISYILSLLENRRYGMISTIVDCPMPPPEGTTITFHIDIGYYSIDLSIPGCLLGVNESITAFFDELIKDATRMPPNYHITDENINMLKSYHTYFSISSSIKIHPPSTAQSS